MACKNFKVSVKCVSASAPDTYQLSPDQLQFYQDYGYLVIQKLIGLPALDSYRQRFVDVCNRRVPKGLVSVVKDQLLYKKENNPENYINKIQELLHDEVFSTYSEDPRLLHVVSQLIGEDLTALNCMLINKPPGTGEHPPHQDQLYLPIRPSSKILATWTAIDPSRKDNGCLFMIPGSHMPGELYEHKDQINDGKQYFYGMADCKALAPEHKRVYLEMEPGDTVFFSPVLIHGSNPNRSKEYRKAMTCHYANSNCQYIEVEGTRQEHLAKAVEAQLRKFGSKISFVDLWQMKTKQVRGARSHL